jgi:hypothetical protein
MKNLFERLLDSLSVPYTTSFTNDLYMTHPNRDNLLGLCQMCASFGISAKGVNIMDKNLDVLSIPAILHVSGHFVILTDLTEDKVTYDREGQTTIQAKEDFLSSWDGNALLIESDKETIEPSYSKHRKQAQRESVQHLILVFLILLCGMFMFFQMLHHHNILMVIFAIIDALGIGTCYMLLQKQAFQSSKIGDKVCSMFHQKDCNNILLSDKAKFYGYSWSEIGLGYFLAHYLIATLLPSSTLVLSVLSWCAMCYGIWSVYYQARVAQQWCILCVLTQILLWINGIASIILFKEFSLHSLLGGLLNANYWIYFLSAAIITTTVAKLFTKSVALKKDLCNVTYQYRSLKNNAIVFKSILHQSKFVPTSVENSTILFGNKRSQLHITILTNPHCSPCAAKHKQVDKLIDLYGEMLSVQFVFFAFNESFKQSNRFLIATFQQKNKNRAREIYRQWYETGKSYAETFMAEYPDINCDNPAVEQEMQRHASWITLSGLSATPTILVNGYILPSEYDLADLPLFTNIQL